MLALLTAALMSGNGNGAALHLDKSLDAKLPCAANAALEQAIKVRLPRVRIAKGKPTGNDLGATISATAGGFRFDVRHADGTIAMSRDLFSGCAQLGDTSALILERYLAQISWAGRDSGLVAPSPPPPKPAPVPPPPEPLPPPPVVVAPEPVDAGAAAADDLLTRIGKTPEPSGNALISAAPPPPASPPPPDAGTPAPVINLPPEPERDPIVSSVDLTAGGGLWFTDRLAGAFSLDLAVTLRERVRLGLLGTFSLPVTRDVPPLMPRGTVQTLDLGAFASLGICTRTAIALCGSALGGARVTFGSVSAVPKRLYHLSDATLLLPELGLAGRAQYAISRFLIALDAVFGVPIGKGALKVEGFDDPYTTPWVDLALYLRVGLRL